MSSYTRGRDVARVAVLAVLGGIAFIGCFLYVTNRGLAARTMDVNIRIASAAGLAKGDPVFYRGVNVGEVRRLLFHEEGGVVIRAKLGQRVRLTQDAYAELAALDLFGRQSLVLKDGSRRAGAFTAADTLQAIVPTAMTARMADLGARAERLVSDTMIALLQQTLAGTAAATQQLGALGASLERAVIAQQSNLTTVTSEAAAVAQNLRAASEPEELIAMRGNMQRATARLDTTAYALSTLVASLENGEGNAGLLLRDDQLYTRTNALLSSLEELARDVKANPKRYINVKVF